MGWEGITDIDIEVVDVSVLSWRRLCGGFMYPVRKVLNILTLCVYKDESFQDGFYTNKMRQDLYMSGHIVDIFIPFASLSCTFHLPYEI